jgi:hypothetical protein
MVVVVVVGVASRGAGRRAMIVDRSLSRRTGENGEFWIWNSI